MTRAIVFGLFLGLAASTGVLCWQAWANTHFECAVPDSEECTFDALTHLELARMQTYAAIGLAFLSSGCFLLSRRR